MSIAALVSGTVMSAPERRTGPSGKPYVLVRLRAADGEHSLVVTVFAFGSAGDVLMALGAGAAVSVSGKLKAGTWTTKDGEARPSLSVNADAVLTAHERTRVDKAVREARERQPAPRSSAPRAALGQARELWNRNPVGASGFDDMADDIP